MKKVIVFIVLGIFLAGGVVALANPFNLLETKNYQNDIFEGFAEIEKSYNEMNNTERALIINEKIITKSEYKRKKEIMKEVYKRNVSDEEVISSFAKKQVTYTLAEELNSTATKKELIEVIEDERSFYENSLPEDQKEAYTKYIEVLGLSEDEYWDEHIKDKMDYFITSSKTKAALIDKYVKSGELEKTVYDNYNDEKYKKFYDNYIDNLIKSANIKIIDISD